MCACVPTWSTCQRASVPARFTCQRACVPAWFTCLCAKSVPSSHFTCQHANERANVPNGVPTFQIGVSTCQRTCQFFKHLSYELLGEISILYFCIKDSTLCLTSYLYMCICIAHKNLLYFISVLHSILKESVWNFCFLNSFCS